MKISFLDLVRCYFPFLDMSSPACPIHPCFPSDPYLEKKRREKEKQTDDVQPAKEEFEKWEANYERDRPPPDRPADTLLPTAPALGPFPCDCVEVQDYAEVKRSILKGFPGGPINLGEVVFNRQVLEEVQCELLKVWPEDISMQWEGSPKVFYNKSPESERPPMSYAAREKLADDMIRRWTEFKQRALETCDESQGM